MAWVSRGRHGPLQAEGPPSPQHQLSYVSRFYTRNNFIFTTGLSRAMGVCVVVGAGLNSSEDKDKVLGAAWRRESSKTNSRAQVGQYGN